MNLKPPRNWKIQVQFYRDRKKLWRWRAIARNGRILADSGQGYKARDKCEHGSHVLQYGYTNCTMHPTEIYYS